ncbi:Nurim like protein [Dufourea novaeangliae]|uniref:Nuclear envelope membrane protein n=1 Tax=Dufourea novaeangliae TaxID=178035 RepID=A0A154P8T8_DUFNO|nr:Nurim like protein [Dufourea novaeangliae]
MSLLSIFIVQHTLMASDFVKHLFCKVYIDYMGRSVYNVASAMALHLLLNQWQIIPSISLWKLDTSSNNVLWFIFTAFHVLGWSIIYSGCLMMDIAELTGLKEIYYKFSSRPSPVAMKSKELLRYYSHMRHPSFTGFIIILWIYPYMTLDRILLASILTVYMALMWTIDKEDYGSNTATTKFVLCPVVDSTPARTAVLYKGQTYLGSSFDNSNTGFMCRTGKVGCISPKTDILNNLNFYSASLRCTFLKYYIS